MVRRKKRNYDDPICHPGHRRPRTRREFLSQGFILGSGSVLGGAMVSLGPGRARAALSPELLPLIQTCGIATQGAGKIPFIAFDLAGGSNQAGSTTSSTSSWGWHFIPIAHFFAACSPESALGPWQIPTARSSQRGRTTTPATTRTTPCTASRPLAQMVPC